MGNNPSFLPEDDVTSLENVNFYRNKIKSHPDGDFIDKIHKEWFGNYRLLEERHSYIQWLFPIREAGMNWSSQPLSKHEATLLRQDPEAITRLLRSLQMQLDFYGIYFDMETRQVKRSANEEHLKRQYHNLGTSFHNYLRITRILKCLGILGCEDIKFRIINHFVIEIFKYHNLGQAVKSCLTYWIPTLRRKSDVYKIDGLIEKLVNQKLNRDVFGWGDEGENWSTQFFPDTLNGHYDENTEFELLEDVLVAESDPFEELRNRFKSFETSYSFKSNTPSYLFSDDSNDVGSSDSDMGMEYGTDSGDDLDNRSNTSDNGSDDSGISDYSYDSDDIDYEKYKQYSLNLKNKEGSVDGVRRVNSTEDNPHVDSKLWKETHHEPNGDVENESASEDDIYQEDLIDAKTD